MKKFLILTIIYFMSLSGMDILDATYQNEIRETVPLLDIPLAYVYQTIRRRDVQAKMASVWQQAKNNKSLFFSCLPAELRQELTYFVLEDKTNLVSIIKSQKQSTTKHYGFFSLYMFDGSPIFTPSHAELVNPLICVLNHGDGFGNILTPFYIFQFKDPSAHDVKWFWVTSHFAVLEDKKIQKKVITFIKQSLDQKGCQPSDVVLLTNGNRLKMATLKNIDPQMLFS